MPEIFAAILTVLYGLSGLVTFFGYLPTIIDLWNKKPSANSSTYFIWTGTMIIAFLYALLINGDPIFAGFVAIQLTACLTILVLRLRLKIRTKKYFFF